MSTGPVEDRGVQFLIQGMLYGQALRLTRSDHLLPGCTVDQRMDRDGIYEPWFDVTTIGGTRIRVSFATLGSTEQERPDE